MRQKNDLHHNIRKRKKHYFAIRLLGSLMVLIVAAVALIIFLNFAKENALQTTSQKPEATVTPAPSHKNSNPDGAAKYSFYDQLQERSKEVQKEIDQQRRISEKRKPIKGRNYRVQVGAFRNPDQADKMQQRMLLMKLPTRIIRSGEFHLVQVGPYVNIEDAEKIQKDLEADNIKTLIKTFVDN